MDKISKSTGRRSDGSPDQDSIPPASGAAYQESGNQTSARVKSNPPEDMLLADRRTVLRSAGAVGIAAVLAACGGGDQSEGTGAATEGGDDGATGGIPTGGGQETPGSGGGAPNGEVLAATSDIPEGGGKIFKDQKVVVTQPTSGTFKGFSAVCQHQGCLVGAVSDGKINCPCHGSAYNIADGSVARGPTTRPLPPVDIMVEGEDIVLA